MNITIVGAGNVGTQIATHCAEKGHKVIIYGSKPEKISKELTVINENGEVIHQGNIDKATSDIREAFESADLIFVIMPATLMKSYVPDWEFNDNLHNCQTAHCGRGEYKVSGTIKLPLNSHKRINMY